MEKLKEWHSKNRLGINLGSFVKGNNGPLNTQFPVRSCLYYYSL